MTLKLRAGDANMLGDCYEKFGRFEAGIRRAPAPGELTTVSVPAGFYWRIEPDDWMLLVYPGWWRKLFHAVTGRWSP